MKTHRNIPSPIFSLFLLAFLAPLPLYAQSIPQQANALLARADSLRAVGDLQAAQKAYEQALKVDKNLLAAYAGLGKIALAEEKWGEAGDRFGDILERDPDNFEAHYYRGICYRETGKFKALLLRKLDWDKSKKHFQWVISRDSLYQDVLYQYAQLLRYRDDYIEAIRHGHAQVRLRPDLVEPQVGLFRLYRYFITHKGEKEAISWLQQQHWDHARYFIGEKLRREGKLAEADSIFQSLLAEPLEMPRQPIFLSLARIHYAQNEPEIAQAYFWRAVDEIDSDVAADLVFEDIKYIVNDRNLETYRSLSSPAEKIVFFRRLWTQRDPTPAASVNVRLAEHYRRLIYAEENYEYDGFRTWFNNPDKLSYLSFPETYKLNHEFNDKGLIYIRQGPPDDRQVTIAEDLPTNESWAYWKSGEQPEMIFHFLIDRNATGNNWRLAPMVTDRRMAEDRATWGSIYHRLLRGDPLERLSLEEEMARESREAVEVGMSTDRHTWGKEMKPLEMPFTMASFRGERGKSEVDVYVALPGPVLQRASKNGTETLRIEKGIAVFTADWQPVAIERDTVALGSLEPNGDQLLDSFRFTVTADSYNVAFHAHPLDTDLLAGWKVDQRFPSFSGPELALSDLLLADRVEPADGPGRFVHNDLFVLPNPTAEFRRDRAPFLYFEIYNLQPDSEGKTAFTIEYTLTLQKGKKGGLFGLFGGGGKSSITVRTDREGTSTDSVEHLAIDVSQMKAGEYTLEVEVRDRNSGGSVSRSVTMALN